MTHHKQDSLSLRLFIAQASGNAFFRGDDPFHFQPGIGRNGFGDLGRTGQVFEKGIKMDTRLHREVRIP
jgi:hypothetical protein